MQTSARCAPVSSAFSLPLIPIWALTHTKAVDFSPNLSSLFLIPAIISLNSLVFAFPVLPAVRTAIMAAWESVRITPRSLGLRSLRAPRMPGSSPSHTVAILPSPRLSPSHRSHPPPTYPFSSILPSVNRVEKPSFRVFSYG